MVTLVTGGTGFVGSAVVRKLLERGERVRALVRENSKNANLEGLNVEIAVGDLRDVESLKTAMRDVGSLYHVAADYRLWARDDSEIYETNVAGTRNLFLAAQDRSVSRIVYTSSVCTLGTNADGSPGDELMPVSLSDMVGAYKRSKFLAEECAMDFCRQGAPIVVVNPSTPIGPRDIRPTPTGRMVRDAAQGKMPAFVNTGLNFVHVDDVAEGHLLAHDRGVAGERYILGGVNLSLKSFLWLIADLMDRAPPKIELPRRAIYPIAAAAEAFAWFSRREPLVTVNGLRLAKKLMYFSSDKAATKLGYAFRPMRETLIAALSGAGVDELLGAGARFAASSVPPAGQSAA